MRSNYSPVISEKLKTVNECGLSCPLGSQSTKPNFNSGILWCQLICEAYIPALQQKRHPPNPSACAHPTLYIRLLISRQTHQCQAVASTVCLLAFTHNELLLSHCPAANEPRPHRSRVHRVPSSCFAFAIMKAQQAGLLLLLGIIVACVSADAPQPCSQVRGYLPFHRFFAKSLPVGRLFHIKSPFSSTLLCCIQQIWLYKIGIMHKSNSLSHFRIIFWFEQNGIYLWILRYNHSLTQRRKLAVEAK